MLEFVGIAVILLLAVYGLASMIEDVKARFYAGEKKGEKPVVMCRADQETVEFVARQVRAISEKEHLDGAVVVQSEREKEMTRELSNVKVMTKDELDAYLKDKLLWG